ncbi:MAG: PLP-dependent transferase, partial [Rhodospirillales bacterium]
MSGKNKQKKWRQATKLVQGGIRRSQFEETSEGLYLTSGYVYPSPEEAEQAFKGDIKRYQYSRYANPTVNMFEERLALLDGARFCFATSSGMAAVFASLACMVGQGGRVVAARALFGPCKTVITGILPRFGVEFELVDGRDEGQWKAALAKKTDAVFLETPSNPRLEMIDIEAV